MRKTLLILTLGAVLGGVGAWWLSAGPQIVQRTELEDPAHIQSVTPASAAVRLDGEARRLAGIEVAPLAALALNAERQAYGRVLDPLPLAGAVFGFEAARAAEEAARREADRVRHLYRGEENASARELEAAELALTRARAALDTARAGLVSDWGEPLTTRDDLPSLARSLVAGERALVRVDLPPGAVGVDPESARLTEFDAVLPLASVFLGAAAKTDPLLQGRGLLFLVERDPPSPGAAVVAWLREPGPPTVGVEVPREALLRYQGGVFVYVEGEPGAFDRRAIELVRPSETGWLATGPLTPGETVVVAGAPLLLSSELQPQLAQD